LKCCLSNLIDGLLFVRFQLVVFKKDAAMIISDLLLLPDVAYLFIVVGLLLSVMALLTPGTGFFEIGAFFALAVAGYQIYNLPINAWAMGVALVGVVLFGLAIRRTKYRTMFMISSIAALVIGSVYLFRGEGSQSAVNPWLAVIVSALASGFLWLIATKTIDIHLTRPNHDLGTLVGAKGVARTDISAEGTVFVQMEDWSAQSEDLISAGDKIKVIGREGLILQVQPLPEGE
jgi:membrane-bound serine protease (ClpP class)